MSQVVKFEPREVLEFGKMWRRVWRKLSPDEQERALRYMRRMLPNIKDAADSSSTKETKP